MKIERVLERVKPSWVRHDVRSNRRFVGLLALISASFLFCYVGVLAGLAGQWWSNDIYSYGFLIPVISAYLVWVRREAWVNLPAVPNPLWGWPVLSAGLLMLIAGKAATVLLLQELSIPVTLTGAALLILGTRFLRVLWLPIAYLLFMIPAWEVVTDRLYHPLQISSANLGVSLLRMTGVPVYQDGVFIYLPNITLEVAKACSGVNYLIAVVAIGIPMAYLFLRGWVKRTVLVGMAVAIAIIGNGVRVALIGLLASRGLAGDIHGPFHVLQGMFVSVVGYVVLFTGAWVLSPASGSSSAQKAGQDSVGKRTFAPTQRSASLFVTLSSVVLLTIGGYIHFVHPVPVPLKKELNEFPATIGGWRGADRAPNSIPFGAMKADRTLSRSYLDGSGDRVDLFLAHFEIQGQGRKLDDYNSDRLFQNVSEIEVRTDQKGAIRVNRQILQEGNGRDLVLFWYDLHGKIVTNRFLAKFYIMEDALVHGRNDGTLIALSVPLSETVDSEHARSTAERFLSEMIPVLADYLPGD